MSRELKFRVWIPGVKAMSNTIHIDDWPPNNMLRKYKAIYMQFTGLHDKNGKEIYEGDIIDAGIDDASVVFFSKLQGAWSVEDRCTSAYNLRHFMAYYGISETPTEKTPSIIGNIYENPELVEDN